MNTSVTLRASSGVEWLEKGFCQVFMKVLESIPLISPVLVLLCSPAAPTCLAMTEAAISSAKTSAPS